MTRRKPREVECILASVASKHGVSVTQLCSPIQTDDLVSARLDAILALTKLGLSPRKVGQFLGARHRTTIRYAIRKYATLPKVVDTSEIPCPDYSGEWAI